RRARRRRAAHRRPGSGAGRQGARPRAPLRGGDGAPDCRAPHLRRGTGGPARLPREANAASAPVTGYATSPLSRRTGGTPALRLQVGRRMEFRLRQGARGRAGKSAAVLTAGAIALACWCAAAAATGAEVASAAGPLLPAASSPPVAAVDPSLSAAAAANTFEALHVIVQARDATTAAGIVEAVGGTVRRPLSIGDG